VGNALAQNNVMTLLIGKATGAPTTAAGSPIIGTASLADGELAVVNGHNIVLSAVTVLTDALAISQGVRVVQRSGTKLVFSDFIKRGNIKSYIGQTDSAATEQLTYVGYNGTSLAIEALNSNPYEMRVKLIEGDVTGFGSQPVIASLFKSDVSASQLEVASGIHLALAGSLAKNPEAPFRAERVVKHTTANDSDNILTVINGSKYVTWTAAATHSVGTPFVAGDTLRIGTAGSGAATTDPAYVLTSMAGLVGTLDVPFQGVTAAVPATDVAHITTPTDWGLKLTGLARGFTVGKQNSINNIVRFLVGLDDFGTTTVTYNTAPGEGFGTYRQIAEMEWFLQGNEGNEDRRDFMHTTARADAVSTSTYDTLSFDYWDDASAGLAMFQRSLKQLIVALETGFTAGEASNIVVDILDNLGGSTSGIGV